MIALIVYEVGYLGLLLLNNLEMIPSVFKLFTRNEIGGGGGAASFLPIFSILPKMKKSGCV